MLHACVDRSQSFHLESQNEMSRATTCDLERSDNENTEVCPVQSIGLWVATTIFGYYAFDVIASDFRLEWYAQPMPHPPP